MKSFLCKLAVAVVLIIAFSANLLASDNPSVMDLSDMEKLSGKGYGMLKDGNYPEALAIYKQVASVAGGSTSIRDLRPYVKSLNNIGYIYLFIQNNPEQAYPYFLRAKKVATEHELFDLLGAVYDNIAKIQSDFGDGENAIVTYSQALRYSLVDSTDVSPHIQLMIFNDLVTCAMAYDAVDRISEPIAIFEQLPEYDMPMDRYSRKISGGLKQYINGDYAASTRSMLEAAPLIDSKVDYERYVVDHNLMLATIYYKRNMPDSALHYLEVAREVALANNLSDKLPRIYRGNGTVLRTNGMENEANSWFLKAYITDDSLHNAKSYAHIKSMEPILDVDILTKEMNLAESRHKHRLTVIWILSLAFIAISVLLIMIVVRNRKLNSSYTALALRHKDSMKQAENAAKLRREYEEAIRDLRQGNKENAEVESESEEPGKQSVNISKEERLRIVGLVNDVMEQSQEVFNPDFALATLAELTDTKPRYLSSVINESIGKTFARMLAEARVRKACQLLLSDDFKRTMTVESVSAEVGYKSRTQFTTIFKKITGLTPIQYISSAH